VPLGGVGHYVPHTPLEAKDVADGITPTMEHDRATRLMVAAKDRPVEGESPIVTAARGLIRDHQIDPVDGTRRVFGGRDEGRLISSISRIDPEASNVGEIGGRLSADVAIQRMGAQRDREISSQTAHKAFESRDRAALHGDVSAISSEKSHFTAGNFAMGKFDRLPKEKRDWVQDSVAFAGREAASRNRDGIGDRMASIGGFMPGSGRAGLSDAMTRSALPMGKGPGDGRPAGGPQPMGKGAPDVSTGDQARFLDRNGRGR
jgi:hypothetical protein